MSAHLEVDRLRVASRDGVLVHDVSFAVRPGVPLTLLGESGSGKSLVVQAIMGTLPAELAASGRIALDGRDLPGLPEAERRTLWGRRIALLPQEPWLALDPTMRVLGQVAEVYRHVRGRPAGDSRAEGRARLAGLGLADAVHRYPFQLSGGMCQRVALAIARAADADLLLADEPTKGLDAALRDGVAAGLRGEADRGRSLITITHDVTVARVLGGEVGVMLDGRLVEYGPAAEVLARPRHDYTRRLLAAEPVAWPGRDRPVPGDPVIRGAGIAKTFGGRTVLDGVDVEVRAGEVVAVLGPSGSGKSTLGNILLGLVPADAGEVRRGPGLAPLRFQKVYQDPPGAFAPQRTLRRALADVGRRHGVAWEVFEGLMRRFRLGPGLLDRRPGQLSGGELQRFALARVLALNPAFLFADEPTSRLDPITQREVADLLHELAGERRLGVLLVTHEAAMAANLAHRVLALEPAAAG
ncbi:ABC transporter ATP-binding protein [Azospirillum halopraeferens]|uniref:ABC transporter ATP-binding protein n=1 Tax=Azospirillum halopraeferens TaxID=34010 RepID=UPI0004272094|nr:ATP-binding cassette domain-containing protein [Azospirillum halopraeferens]